MILGDRPVAPPQPPQGQHRVTIDEVFRQVAQRRPDALALADAPNRETFTAGAPRRLTYAEAERMVAAMAGRLRRMGLPTDAIVGIQLPNIVEHVLAMLAVLRAGMIVAPLPLLWRRSDVTAALARIGAKALITCGHVTCGHVGSFDHAQFAMQVAAEVFPIRYVCGFGPNLPDGVVPFDDVFTAEAIDPIPPLEREQYSNVAAHIAAISFDVGAGGLTPVARNHPELLAGGLGILLESRLPQDSTVLSTIAPSSFAGISLTLLPWLLSGGTLMLHHPVDVGVLAGQLRENRCGTLVLPAYVASRLAEAGVFSHNNPSVVIAAWRAPEQLAASPEWRETKTSLTDVAIFGEAGVVAARRGADGRPAPLSLGPIMAPRGSTGGVAIGELGRTDAGTLALRGPMVPHYSFPPGIETSELPHFKIGRDGFVDSGYACSVDSAANAVVVTAAPSGIVSVGGYRFALQELQEIVGRIDGGATLAGLPDPLLGQRLSGTAADPAAIEAALDAAGANPLVAAAFREHGVILAASAA